ncbi:hypothetical protein [Paenibacillus sp. GCM10027626]
MTQGPKTAHAANLSSWVKQIARNTALDWLRKYKKIVRKSILKPLIF